MISFLVRRTLWALLLFVVITLVTFVIFFVIPGNPGRTPRGQELRLNEQISLSGPVYRQYGQFLWRVVTHRSLGYSIRNHRSVNAMVGQALPVTASLVVGGMIVWLLIAVPLGILSALRPRSLLDRGGMVFVLFGISAHPLWIGLVFSYFFGFKLRVLPISGYCEFFSPVGACGGPAEWAYHLILPWLTFAILFAALYTRMIRASVLETLHEDYVRTARAKGAPEWLVIRSHVLRNALLPVVTMLGMDVGLYLGGSIFVETVYGLPGLGKMAAASLARQDLASLLGVVVVVTTAIVVLNLLIDVLYAWVDPRIRVTAAASS